MTTGEMILLVLEIIIIVLLVLLWMRKDKGQTGNELVQKFQEISDRMQQSQTSLMLESAKSQQENLHTLEVKLLKEHAENNTKMQETLQNATDYIRRTNEEKLTRIEREMSENRLEQQKALNTFSERQQKDFQEVEKRLLQDSNQNREQMQTTIRTSLEEIRQANDLKITELRTSNEEKLSAIQKDMNEKLDHSLNARLDESFKQIGERLESLYKSLGELRQLESGVSNLNRTLSNVKTRGIFGEVQLGNILAETLEKSQYAENVATKKNSADRVEFAVKIPDKENKGGFIYLPIDSKFPADIYDHIQTAADQADADGLRIATNELKTRIKSEAMTIRDKYLAPPDTTDFAILFLPTEGLYSEVLRIPGLVEECQKQYRIVISGPTTITALLNSLSIGFKYLTVNKNAQDILKTLSAVKTQYGKFTELIEKVQKKLDEAQKTADSMKSRSDMIQRKLAKVESMDGEKAERFLENDSMEAEDEI